LHFRFLVVMSTIVDVSSKLGEYMLKGWILTDEICTKCSKVPLMRSPSPPATYFCANCDAAGPSTNLARSGSSVGPTDPRAPVNANSSSHSTSSHPSRSSTPPTDVSGAPSSPALAPIDTEVIIRRRQQSDRASAEIGKRMLQGWAMLADECPSPTCYGIPLVRPPKRGSEKDPRKECVICGTVYIDQKDSYGRNHLVALRLDTAPEASVPQSTSFPRQDAVDHPVHDVSKAARNVSSLEITPQHQVSERTSGGPIVGNATVSALGTSEESLQLSLHTLSDRLKQLSAGPVVDPSLIAQTADAIGKVCQALTQVKQLQWSELAAHAA